MKGYTLFDVIMNGIGIGILFHIIILQDLGEAALILIVGVWVFCYLGGAFIFHWIPQHDALPLILFPPHHF